MQRRIPKRFPKSTAQPLKLKIARGLDALKDIEVLTIQEQTLLARVNAILSGRVSGRLTGADWANMMKIARKYRKKLF